MTIIRDALRELARFSTILELISMALVIAFIGLVIAR